MQDLAGFVEHLHLLLGVSVVREDIDLRDDVVGQLVGEFLDLDRIPFHDVPVLLLQFRHGLGTGAGSGLVAGHMDAGDVGKGLDGFQDDHHHDGRAVGVGDDAAGTHQGVFGIALGNDEGHVRIHPERAGVVDHHGAVLGDGVGEFHGRAGTGRDEGIIDALEIVIVLQEPDFEFLAAETVFAARTACRPEQNEFVHGEIPLFEDLDKFLADSAAGADYCCFHNL